MQFGPYALREAKAARKLLVALAESGEVVALPDGTMLARVVRKAAWRIVRPGHVV